MPKMIQIRHVPDDLHRKLKIRAAEKGMSLSDYLLSELEEIAEQPTLEEFVERIRRLPPVELDEEPAETIRRFREGA
jgi:plasmid stability protein